VVRDCSQFRFGAAPGDATEAKAFAFAMIGRAEPLEAALMVRLSKIVDYLIDNLCLYILSRVEA
jgi:hypothetical protein